MDTLLILAILAVVIVLIFDYTNGFHDASNIIATVIASRAMTPIQAVIIVATFEFLGPLLGGTAVANTIGKFVDVSELQSVASVSIILCGIIGIFKRRELYRHMSNAADRLARAGEVLHDIVVKIS